MIAIQDHGTNESSLETLPLFGAIKRRKFLKICCNLIDTNRDSAYYEARNKLLKLIASNCQRTKPSLRDSHKLKDVILLLKSIIKNRTITKWSLGIA